MGRRGTVLLICDVLSSRHSSSTGRMTFCLLGWPLGTSAMSRVRMVPAALATKRSRPKAWPLVACVAVTPPARRGSPLAAAFSKRYQPMGAGKL